MKQILRVATGALGLAWSAYVFAGPATPPAVSADNAWAGLQAALPSAAHPGTPGKNVDWLALATAAEAFAQNFPADANVAAATRIALVARIHADDGKPNVNAATLKKAEAFLADATNPVRDRVEVAIAAAQATLRRTTFKNRGDWLAANEAHGRDLIQKFPGEPEGYGYLLAQAKAEESANAKAIVAELLASNAPATIKASAQQVLDRLTLEGKPFQLAGAEAAIAGAKDRVLVVYAWTSQDTGYLEVIKRMSRDSDLRFIGINLDSVMPDSSVTSALPGLQLYEPNGLSGPLAQQLKLLYTPSVYLVDQQGVVHDVNALTTAESKAAALVVAKGGNS